MTVTRYLGIADATRRHPPSGEVPWVRGRNRDGEPHLSLEYAGPVPPMPEGSWIYTESHDCKLDGA